MSRNGKIVWDVWVENADASAPGRADTPMTKSEKPPEAHMEDVTKQEREDRILTLVFRHGLDGWAATAAADDPKLYALFEPEMLAAA